MMDRMRAEERGEGVAEVGGDPSTAAADNKSMSTVEAEAASDLLRRDQRVPQEAARDFSKLSVGGGGGGGGVGGTSGVGGEAATPHIERQADISAADAAALDPENFDAGERGEGASTLERPRSTGTRGERAEDDDYSRAAANDEATPGGLPGEAARMGLRPPAPRGSTHAAAVEPGTVADLSPEELEARAEAINPPSSAADAAIPRHGRR